MRFVIVLVGLVACKSKNEACLHYAEVYRACAHEAEGAGLPVDVDTSDPDAFCEQMGDMFTDEQWDCQSKAYGDVDCSTEDGLAEGLTAAEAC